MAKDKFEVKFELSLYRVKPEQDLLPPVLISKTTLATNKLDATTENQAEKSKGKIALAGVALKYAFTNQYK